MAAVSKVAGQGVSIVVKELKGLKLSVQLANRINKILQLSDDKRLFYVDNTIILDQIEACREKGYSQLTRGVGNLIAKIVSEVPKAQLNFVPSEYNSADNLTRLKTVEQIFSKDATWFQPSVYFNQPTNQTFRSLFEYK